MPTAPSFQSYKVLSAEPFLKNGKQYITVQHPTTGNSRDVRWYSDAEYAKAYGKPATVSSSSEIPNLRKVFGFANGPILIIRNNKPTDEEWLNQSCARYATNLGWYIVSTDVLPLDTPSHLALVPLTFSEFSTSEATIRDTKELTRIINGKVKNRNFLSPATLLGKEEIAS